MKFFALALLFTAAPAFAQSVWCSDNNDGDYIITLDVENGQISNVVFDNQDWGAAGIQPLTPDQVTYQGATLLYNGDTYQCQ